MGSQDRAVAYLSAAMPVNMGDWWFDVATSDHFWIRRRFEVMRRLADPAVRTAKRAAEIGCGNGLLQKDIEDCYGIPVAGFELNEIALQKSVSRMSPLYCYNIHQRNAEFRGHFDLSAKNGYRYAIAFWMPRPSASVNVHKLSSGRDSTWQSVAMLSN